MKLKKISIGGHDTYRGGIRFEFENDVLSIYSYQTKAAIIQFLRDIIDSYQNKKQLVQTRFDNEGSWYDIILINYPPGDVLKIEIYENALWDFFDDGREPIPPPIFTDFTSHHGFAYLICQGIEEQGAAFFDEPEYPYPAEELEILRRMMVGGYDV